LRFKSKSLGSRLLSRVYGLEGWDPFLPRLATHEGSTCFGVQGLGFGLRVDGVESKVEGAG
jgi:hypothetical protein